MPNTTSNELKSKAMDLLVMAHGLRHENINPLIGKYLFLLHDSINRLLQYAEKQKRINIANTKPLHWFSIS